MTTARSLVRPSQAMRVTRLGTDDRGRESAERCAMSRTPRRRQPAALIEAVEERVQVAARDCPVDGPGRALEPGLEAQDVLPSGTRTSAARPRAAAVRAAALLRRKQSSPVRWWPFRGQPARSPLALAGRCRRAQRARHLCSQAARVAQAARGRVPGSASPPPASLRSRTPTRPSGSSTASRSGQPDPRLFGERPETGTSAWAIV
jgi:hypothetical protein